MLGTTAAYFTTKNTCNSFEGFNYLPACLHLVTTDHGAVNEVNNLGYNFLWDGKGDKIKCEIMICDYEQL